jgi:hypothetical protein
MSPRERSPPFAGPAIPSLFATIAIHRVHGCDASFLHLPGFTDNQADARLRRPGCERLDFGAVSDAGQLASHS